jgi:hypothetical protein
MYSIDREEVSAASSFISSERMSVTKLEVNQHRKEEYSFTIYSNIYIYTYIYTTMKNMNIYTIFRIGN